MHDGIKLRLGAKSLKVGYVSPVSPDDLRSQVFPFCSEYAIFNKSDQKIVFQPDVRQMFTLWPYNLFVIKTTFQKAVHNFGKNHIILLPQNNVEKTWHIPTTKFRVPFLMWVSCCSTCLVMVVYVKYKFKILQIRNYGMAVMTWIY